MSNVREIKRLVLLHKIAKQLQPQLLTLTMIFKDNSSFPSNASTVCTYPCGSNCELGFSECVIAEHVPEHVATPHPRGVDTAVNVHPCLTALAGAELHDEVEQQVKGILAFAALAAERHDGSASQSSQSQKIVLVLALGEGQGVEETDNLITGHLEEVALDVSHWVREAGVPDPVAGAGQGILCHRPC